MAKKIKRVSEARQRYYLIPTIWGPVRAMLMLEVDSDFPIAVCNVCGKPVSRYLSFTDDNGLEVAVGRGCFKKCEVDG